LWIPLAIYDGFWAEKVDADSKGWNLVMALWHIIFGVIILVSAVREKKNVQPMKGCLIYDCRSPSVANTSPEGKSKIVNQKS
jgi:hypothetical protein